MKEKLLELSRKISFFQIRFFLLILYVLVISPIAIIWKLIGKDPLIRKVDKKSQTYYLDYKQAEIELSDFSKPY